MSHEFLFVLPSVLVIFVVSVLFLFVCRRSMLLMSLDCQLLIAPLIFSNVCVLNDRDLENSIFMTSEKQQPRIDSFDLI